MKKTILILTLLFALAATPALANQGNGKGPQKNNQVLGIEVEPTEITLTQVPCDPKGQYKNHGKYVSCVAKQHLGGKKVSEAARSQIGKKKSPSVTPSPSVSSTISPTVTVTPTATPSVSPTETPTITPSVSPTEVPSPTPTDETNSEENTNLGQQIQGLINKINELIETLKNLATL